MFTGIVEEAGAVVSFEERQDAWRLKLSAEVVTADLKPGDSIAVNGCCLTVVSFGETFLEFDILNETKRMTSIDRLVPGDWVNLERSLLPSTRMGGHFVSGHVDGTGVIEVIEQRGKDFFLRIKPEPDKLRYIVSKGCIAVDGISLTVSEVDKTGFALWLIPHTLQVTNLHTRKAGDRVNLEYDLIAKYVEKSSVSKDSKHSKIIIILLILFLMLFLLSL